MGSIKAPQKGNVYIIPVGEGKTLKLPKLFSKHRSFITAKQFTGAHGTICTLPGAEYDIVFLGIGKKTEFSFPEIHNAFGDLVRSYLGKVATVSLVAEGFYNHAKDEAEALYESAYMLQLAGYSFQKYKALDKLHKDTSFKVIVERLTKDDKATVVLATALADAVKFSRDHVNEPSNVATPKYLAYALKSDAYKKSLKVDIMDHKKILRLGLNLIDAVGRGSSEAPYFVRVTYVGDKKSKKHVALVGKGVSFDSGGVQVKPDFYMNTMKGDMGGAGLVMGVMHALALLRPKVNVVAYLPFVQNMPDGNAFKPDDVYTAFNGKTVEIVHTDAEGRLILADALAYACHEKPSEVLDFATLTGASIVAVGQEYAAMLGTNQEGMDALSKLGTSTGDKVWQLPLDNAYKSFLKSDIADIANVPKTRAQPGVITAGHFLEEFVDKEIPWVHLDIAPVAMRDKPQGLHTHFATGFGVRLIYEYLTKDKS